MATQEAAGRSGTSAPEFVIRERDESGERESRQDTRETVGGFVVSDPREENAEAGTTVGVEQPLPRGRRCSICGDLGHTARTCQNEGSAAIGTRASKKPSKDAVGAIAPMLVGTANFCVVTTFGTDCGLTELEAKMLVPSLQRMLERMPASAATRAAVIIDPLVIVTVMAMWAKRIAATKDREAKEKYAVKPAEQARANGVADTVYSVSQPTPQQAVVTPTTDKPAEATANGVPEQIRRSFDDAI